MCCEQALQYKGQRSYKWDRENEVSVALKQALFFRFRYLRLRGKGCCTRNAQHQNTNTHAYATGKMDNGTDEWPESIPGFGQHQQLTCYTKEERNYLDGYAQSCVRCSLMNYTLSPAFIFSEFSANCNAAVISPISPFMKSSRE